MDRRNIMNTIILNPTWGLWGGHIDVTINNDELNGKANITAVLNYYGTESGVPKQGYYRPYLYIAKDGQVVSEYNPEGNASKFYLSEAVRTVSCTASITYEESCTITVGGYVICEQWGGGALAGSSISGSGSETIYEAKPASTVSVSQNPVKMGKNLIITISRYSGDYTHTLEYAFGDEHGTIATGVSSRYSWTVPDLSASCNDAVSGVCEITCKTYKNGNYIGSNTVNVSLTVPDPTTPSVENGVLTMGVAGAISCMRNSPNFTIVLEYYFGDASGRIAEGKIDSYSWAAPYDLAKQIPNLTYGTGTIRCTTMNGTAQVGYYDINVQFIVPENSATRPSFFLEGLSLSPISDLGDSFSELYLRGKTGLKAEFTASSAYSAIQSYNITVGSVSASGNPAIIHLLINEGTVAVTAKVTDARGFSTTVSTTINILPYRKPKVVPYTGYSNVICERALETGGLDTNGTYLAIKAGKSYSSVVVNGTEMNHCVLRYRWKMSGVPDYGEWITLLAGGSAEMEISVLISNIVSSLETSYDVEICAVDSLGGEHKLSFQIMTGSISFELYEGVDGAGFGKHPESPHVVDVAAHMTLLVRGKLVVLGASWASLDLADGMEESPYDYGRQDDTGCYYHVSNGNHVQVAFNCAYSYAGSAMVVNRTPIPEEYRPKWTVCSICPANDRMLALITVQPDGYIRIEWVQSIASTSTTASAAVLWVDGYIDYWV